MKRFAFTVSALSLLYFSPASIDGTEVLNEFRPSPIRSPYGAVSEVHFSTEMLELESGVLAYHADHGMKHFRFAEPVWIVGYRTEIVDSENLAPHQNYLCHTFFGDRRVTQHDDQEMIAIYSDAFTPEVRLPGGFGLYLSAGEVLHWMPMFNNREERPVRVRMKGVISVIREKDRTRPLQRLYSTLRSVRIPHLFFVPPGRHEINTTFNAPFDGRIHFMGTHIHPYGVSVELYDLTRDRVVWRSTRKLDPNGRLVGMDVFSSVEGYPIKAGQSYRIAAVYENPSSEPIDAMAGLFLLYTHN